MKRFIVAAAAGAVLALASGRELAAQALSGDDVMSLAFKLGAVSPTTTLTDNTKFGGGLAGGVSFAYWPMRNLGLRLNYEMGKTEGNKLATAAASQEDPTVSFYGGELNLRYPLETGSLVLSPYGGGGAGIKQYDWSLDSTGIDRDLAFAWNLTAGVEIQPVSLPIGIVVEAQRFSSKYKWHAMFWEPPTVSDLVFTVGVSLHR